MLRFSRAIFNINATINRSVISISRKKKKFKPTTKKERAEQQLILFNPKQKFGDMGKHSCLTACG